MDNRECPQCRSKSLVLSQQGDFTQCMTCGWRGPKCFASLWDPNNVKCTGGADPTFWNNGTHVRPRCNVEHKCRVEQDRCNKEQLIQPMNNLTRPWQSVEVAGQQPTQIPINQAANPYYQPQMRPAVPSPVNQNYPTTAWQPRPMQPQPTPQVQPSQVPIMHAPTMGAPMAWVPPGQAASPVYVPQNYPAPGMQIPAYLTNPEPPDQGIVSMMVNSCIRAALKGAFHTAANLMDHIPWGGRSKPS